MKISAFEKVKLATMAKKILSGLKENPKKQDKLIRALRANGFDDIADLAEEASKYIDEV